MKSSDMIRQLCVRENVSVAELARRIGQSPQNFGKKLKRDTVSFDEMLLIADALEISYEQAFIFKDGEKIYIGNTQT